MSIVLVCYLPTVKLFGLRPYLTDNFRAQHDGVHCFKNCPLFVKVRMVEMPYMKFDSGFCRGVSVCPCLQTAMTKLEVAFPNSFAGKGHFAQGMQ